MVNNITSVFGLDFSVNVIICWKCECFIFGTVLSGVFPQIMLGQYPVPGPSGKDYVARNFEATITEQNGSAMLCGNSKIESPQALRTIIVFRGCGCMFDMFMCKTSCIFRNVCVRVCICVCLCVFVCATGFLGQVSQRRSGQSSSKSLLN